MKPEEKLLPFDEYVHKYSEVIHSGIGSNVNRLFPDNAYSMDQMTASLKALAEYAHYSITAYRAIEWWASVDGYVPAEWLTQDSKSTLPKDILARINKPTSYQRMSFETVVIEE